MKRLLRIILPFFAIISLLLACIPSNAAKYTSIAKNPDYHYGIDVSQWNGDLDWDMLRNSGVEFAYIRIGYYHNDGGTIDKRFRQNIKGCVESGIDFGIYVYSYVYKHSDTVKCAEWVNEVLESMGNYTKDKDTIQVAYDIEDDVQKNAILKKKVTRSYMHNGVQKFCDEIEEFGYQPVVYSFSSFFNDYLYVDSFQAKGIRIWYAFWPFKLNAKKKMIMENGTCADVWQFSSSYTIGGTVFDTNVCYKDFYDYSLEDSDITVTGLESQYAYDSDGVKPNISVYDSKGMLLTNGVDYKVVYFNNDRAGKARLKIIRYENGAYLDSKTYSFVISPVGVKNLYASSEEHDEVTIKWDKLNGASSYQIFEYDESDGTYNQVDTVTSNKYTDCFLDENKEYKLRVRAVTNINGKKVYSDSQALSVYTKYKPVDFKSVKSGAKRKAALKWTAKTADTKGYIIEYSRNEDFSNKGKRKITNASASGVTFKKLKSGYTYFFRIRSYNRVDGETIYSSYSDVKTAKIK